MSLMKDARKMVKDRPFLVLAAAGTVGYYSYLKQIQLATKTSVAETSVAETTNPYDVPLDPGLQNAVDEYYSQYVNDVPLDPGLQNAIMGMNAGIGHLSDRQSKELSDIESQLKKASKMHAGQAKRISDLGMTTSTSTTTSSSHMPSLRNDSAGEPSIHIPAGSGLFGTKKKFSQVGGSARRRLGSVAREPSPVYGAHIDTQLSLTSSQKNSFMTEQHSDILGFSGLSAGQSGSWYE